MPRFQKFFDAWRTENAAQIAAGSKFIHEQAAKGGVDADAGMAKLADADVERLRKTSTRVARAPLPADPGIVGAARDQWSTEPSGVMRTVLIIDDNPAVGEALALAAVAARHPPADRAYARARAWRCWSASASTW